MKIYNGIRTCIFVALAILVLIFLKQIAQIEQLRYFIGALILFYGAEEITYTAFKNKKHYSFNSLYWNIVEIVIGITLIVFVENGDIDVTYAVVCVAWATWSILRETRELVEVSEKFKELCLAERIIGILNVTESLVVIGFSISMLIEPTEHHAAMHLYLLFVELVTKVLFEDAEMIIHPLLKRHKVAEEQIDANEPGEEQTQEVAATEDVPED